MKNKIKKELKKKRPREMKKQRELRWTLSNKLSIVPSLLQMWRPKPKKLRILKRKPQKIKNRKQSVLIL